MIREDCEGQRVAVASYYIRCIILCGLCRVIGQVAMRGFEEQSINHSFDDTLVVSGYAPYCCVLLLALSMPG
jgi:hypothetical protein